MKLNCAHTKILAVLMLALAVNFCFASFSGKTFDEHSNKFSLKNLSTFSKSYSLSYLRVGSLRFVGTQQLNQQKTDTSVQGQSMMRIQRGNTTFVYPYTYRVKVPKFKTPTPPAFR